MEKIKEYLKGKLPNSQFTVYDDYTVLQLLWKIIIPSINCLIDDFKLKTDLFGDHKGTWQGLDRPTLSEEGMRATVEQIKNEEIPKIHGQRNIFEYANLVVNNDWTHAFKKANEECTTIYVPKGEYLITQQIKLNALFVGSGMDKTILLFKGVNDSAIITEQNHDKKGFKRLTIKNNNWNNSPCLSYGIEADKIIFLDNVKVVGFKKSNIFLHHDITGHSAPYYSMLINVYSEYSAEHGLVVGTGANSIQIVNPVCRWNGASEYLVAPTKLSNFDGIYVSEKADGNPNNKYPVYTPEGVRIVGGDCSYNSRYGFNINSTMHSHISTDYAELNLNTNNIALGEDVRNCYINFAMGKPNDFKVSKTMFDSYPNKIFIGGVSYGGGYQINNRFIESDFNIDKVLSLGANCNINKTSTTEGHLKFTGSGFEPSIIFDNIKRVNMNAELNTKEVATLEKVWFKPGGNADMGITVDNLGYLTVGGNGFNPTINFDTSTKIKELKLGSGNEVSNSTQTATKKIKVNINGVDYYLLATT